MKISNIMTSSPHTIGPTATIFDAAKKMYLVGCRFLPVGTPDKIIGVITDCDIVYRVIALEKDPHQTNVVDVMKKNPIVLSVNDTWLCGIEQMKKNDSQHALVQDNDGKLIGILSFMDVIYRIHDQTRFTWLVNKLLGR